MQAGFNAPDTQGDIYDKFLTVLDVPLDRSTAACLSKDMLRRLMAQDIAESSKTNAEGSVTYANLLRLGWKPEVVESHGLAASAMVSQILNERAPAPEPSMIPAGLRLLADNMLDKAANIANHHTQLKCALTQKDSDYFSTIARIDCQIAALRHEAKAMAALGDAMAGTIARLKARAPLRGLRG